MTLYVETSALVKLFIDEEGSERARSLMRTQDLLTCRLTRVEARAALATAARVGRINKVQHLDAKRELDDWLDEVVQIDISDELARVAGDIAETHSLRGYDAVHLASALAVQEEDLALATWDRELADAAARSGLVTAGIE